MSLALVLLAAAATALAATPRPTVIWHGMGDTCCYNFSMGAVKAEIEKSIPGVYVYSVEIGNSLPADEFHGFFGNVNDQVDFVCNYVKSDPNLAGGFNALGFSQGGQFLRAYVERCNDPPVYNLITFGGQHLGVTDIPYCFGTNLTLCRDMDELLSLGAYADGVRNYSVQAQYFRSPLDYDTYLEKNIFLADINNERPVKNETYKQNLISLNEFVMIMFEYDITVVPKQSEWFGDFLPGTFNVTVPIWEQPIYTEDWIGLQELNAKNKLSFLKCPGAHMQFTMEYLHNEVIVPFLTN